MSTDVVAGIFTGGIYNIAKAAGGGYKKDKETPPPAPAAPDPNAIQAQEKAAIQKKLANRTQTVFSSSPLGAVEAPNTEKKVLLGQ